MIRSINHNDTLFEQVNLTPIRGKTTLKMLHKLQNDTKSNAKAVYCTIRGGAHGHLVLVLANA